MQQIRVLIVDDSASVRQTLVDVLESEPDIAVMGTASDPFVAARRIQEEVPDVILLDVEMPRMDGITFLRKIMAQRPIPVIMCSAVIDERSSLLIEAMEAGAVDVIVKPRVDTKQYLMESRVRICDAVRAAAKARLTGLGRRHATPRPVQEKLTADAVLPPPTPRSRDVGETETIVCIGASTGGTESLKAVLEVLPADCPPILIVQHMPEKFTEAFARRLDGLCAMEVKEAEDGDLVTRGRVLIAPGNRHMLLQRSGQRYTVQIKDGPLVARHRPSVDVLFRSAARTAGSNGVGIIMTGMGDDGARGLLEMKQTGAHTIAQDEASCIVFGMPKEAIALGCVDRIVPLDLLPVEITRAGNR
ncbi:chemotaxis response regulator protein-glutamate methylesterase [Lacibacterium aquatile]|uniref:Protein-glutamate methylesterase/protein-glutamine glutaminase n=1 Tax=Lacibacterium aquatile TaxID=1168082 RepID=A0ABW5DKV6_9PROT